MRILFSTSLLCFLINVTTNAQWTSNTSLNTTVSDQLGSNEATPLMVTVNSGSTYVSWFQPVAGTNYELRMQRLNQNGVGQWGPAGLLVSNFPQNSALYRYDLKADNDGNAIVAFQDERSGHLDIVAYKIDPNGTQVWGANGIALTDPASSQGLAPNIGITTNNDIFIAWNAYNGSNKWIAVQKITAAGNTSWPNIMEIRDITNVKRYSRPTMVPSLVDDVVMLYVQETGSGFGVSTMLSQHFDINGLPVWPQPITVSTYNIPFFYFPAAVNDHNGGFFVGFNTSLPAAPSTGVVYLQHVNSAGSTWNATGVSASTLPNSQRFSPQTLFDAVNNEVYVLIKATDPNQGQSGVYVQKFSTAGTVSWNPNGVQLVPIQAAYNDPNTFSLTPTGVIVTYSTGSNINKVLNAVKVDTAGTLQWSANSVPVCNVNMGKDDVWSGIFASNQVVIVWMDERNGGGIYAQNINDNGILGSTSGINDNIETNALFNIYPNPSSELHIYVNSTDFTSLQITDLAGRVVFNKIGDEITSGNLIVINKEFSNGIYLISMTVNENKYQKLWMHN